MSENIRKIKRAFRIFLNYIYHIIYDVINNWFSIKEGTDVEGTIASIKKGIPLRGTNIWILICSAMLASIGLDTNSTAIIIGAMLISPLMSPILGVGLSIGITDKELLQISLKNFIAAFVISLLTSTVYFLLTPLGQITSELTARTTPTLLDVGVAIFGGLAGIVANSRKEVPTVIPGVAIATALMPPLCTAGFGLATGNYAFFFGAFYLFFINAVFISLATYFLVRYLKFPHTIYLDKIKKVKIRRMIYYFTAIVIIPSTVIFYNVVSDARIIRNFQLFINENINNDFTSVVDWQKIETDSMNIFKLFIVGEPVDSNKVSFLNRKLNDYGISDYVLKLVQMNLHKDYFDEKISSISINVARQLDMSKDKISFQDRKIDSLNNLLDFYKPDTSIIVNIFKEASILFPQIKSFSYGIVLSKSSDTLSVDIPTCLIEVSPKLTIRNKREISAKLEEFIKLRMGNESIRIFIY